MKKTVRDGDPKKTDYEEHARSDRLKEDKFKPAPTENCLPVADIGGGGRKKDVAESLAPAGERASVAVKYRNMATGESWVGRGKRPR